MPLASKITNGRLRNYLNALANKQDYLNALRAVILRLHQSEAVYRETVPVHETFQGKTVWQGEVEVFDLTQHSKAKRCYAWSVSENGEPKYTTVLEIPPVDSPESAVKVAIAATSRKES